MPPPAGRKVVSLLDLPMDPGRWRMLLAFAILSTPAGYLAGTLLQRPPGDGAEHTAPPPARTAAAGRSAEDE